MNQSQRAARRELQEKQRAAKAFAKMGPTATEVWVVRHGQTDWNVEHRLQGQSELDPGLNAVGNLQAQALAQHFAPIEINAIYSSDLARAVQTARAISSNQSVQVQYNSGLRERHLGILQGLTVREAAEQQPHAFSALRDGGTSTPIPGGGESLDQLQARVVHAVQQVAAQHPGERVLLVVHGGVMHAMYRHTTGRQYNGKVVNGAVGRFMVQGGTWVLQSWNEGAAGLHPEAAGSAQAAAASGGFGGGANEA
mmetsp:Transcript_591/g.1344  ORF Transcript_591/g.1344 Transcript_591/m.1344 type:complete len:253 (-) Transcript_591:1023-1781(-)|eukprot:CAMPEP_0202920394 /NCGR_PEP_ID=MMETSP1392-20130828/76836_1 /ASSEMBLY_ACC=CAM_ASM_000868 /TAXON_ID=225041 /ORGANISM="Chlamydomonas chlamydogama, Strain SAG 11-48b" /LENGTH=252 /DNA_ID=CAMNT_0049613889 /DNA_START=45 /DNA_END=803 /DNA_ORIENTATION=+